ncbi:MAG: hypothetical protein K2G30_09660 [Muribaculaceae bacterium]|nr:hypothetical protein [Muribaculaceae bacterium]
MAFFKSLKRAFGFDSEEIEDDFSEGIDATVTPLKERIAAVQQQDGAADSAVAAEAETEAGTDTGEEAEEGGDEAARQLIFRHAVKLINESLPAFLSSALDPEEQERFLLNALDEGMKEYLSDIEQRARRSYDDRWAREKTALDGQFETMREKLRKGEEDGAEAKKQQLSAERQKRALGERVRDLEQLVSSLQAENEQYLLENKSLVNKLRICSVQDGDSDGIRGELDAKSAEIQSLKAEIERLNAEAEVSRAKIEELGRGADQAVATHELSQAMVNDLQTRAKDALTRAEEASSQLDEAKALAEQLRTDAEAARTQAEDLRGQLAKARQQLKIVQEVREQLLSLEQDKIASDSEIARLRDAARENETLLEDMRADVRRKNTALAQRDAMLQQAEEEKRRLEDMTDSLRKTIESNLHHQAQSEALLRSEIDRLKNLPAAPVAPGQPESVPTQVAEDAATYVPVADAVPEAVLAPGLSGGGDGLLEDFSDFHAVPAETLHPSVTDHAPEPAPKPRRTRARKKDADKPKISAIDESIDSTNWLIATPPASRKAKAEAAEAAAANEFGYQEPTRRQPPESPAQMLLW